MDEVSVVLGISNLATGLLLFALLLPLWLEKVPRNHWYGFRFRSSLANDRAWYAVNRYGAGQMLVWSAGVAAVGVLCLFIPLEKQPPVAMAAGLAPLWLLVPAVQAWRFGRRMEG